MFSGGTEAGIWDGDEAGGALPEAPPNAGEDAVWGFDADAPDPEVLVPEPVRRKAACWTEFEGSECGGLLEEIPLTRGRNAGEWGWGRGAAGIAGRLAVVESSGVDVAIGRVDLVAHLGGLGGRGGRGRGRGGRAKAV